MYLPTDDGRGRGGNVSGVRRRVLLGPQLCIVCPLLIQPAWMCPRERSVIVGRACRGPVDGGSVLISST